MGLGRGCVWTRHIFYCLTYCSGRHQKFAFITTHNYSGTLFSFKPETLLIMNDLRATVILIRWKKHSNQMEAGPGGLGEGLRRVPSFSLALMLAREEAGGGKPSLRARYGPGSGTRSPPRGPGLRVRLPAARRALGRGALGVSERKQRRAAASTRASLARPQSGSALCGWRL